MQLHLRTKILYFRTKQRYLVKSNKLLRNNLVAVVQSDQLCGNSKFGK